MILNTSFYKHYKAMMNPFKAFPAEAFKSPSIKHGADLKTGGLLISSLIINVLSLALPIFTLQIYDRIIASHNTGTLNVLTFAVILAVILEFALRISRAYVMGHSAAVIEHVISCNMLRHSIASDLHASERLDIGEQLVHVSSVSKVRDFLSGQALISLVDIPFAVIFLGLIYYISGMLVLVPITLLALFLTVSLTLNYKIKLILDDKDESEKQRLSFVIEALNNIHNIKSQALENNFIKRYESLQLTASKEAYYLTKYNSMASSFGAIFNQVMMVSVIGIGALMALEGYITMGTLIAVMLLSGRIMSPFQKALVVWVKYQGFLLANEKINSVFETPTLTRFDPEDLPENSGEVLIHDLKFSYTGSLELLFNNLNLELKKGAIISISGDHSSGKTTLLKLISGLYQPQSGQVMVNGMDATKYPARGLIKNIGFLTTEGIIFRGTIYQNLSAFGEIPSDNVLEMCQLLDLNREILKLPNGYDTMLEGTQSDPIPPGLKQRIAIARALAPKPRIIIFDNADKALDNAGYNSLYRLLARLKGKATLILVSDDYNITRLATREYVLSNGKLAERNYADQSKVYDIKPFQELKIK